MVSEEPPAFPAFNERNGLTSDLLAPLATISTRMDLLQRLTMVTPGLNDLERMVLLEGLAATRAAAQQLTRILETRITGPALAQPTAYLARAVEPTD